MAYNDAPSDEIFDAIKREAIKIWQTYDDQFGYASEKIDRVNSLTNFKDNWGTMVGMFDPDNQRKLLDALIDSNCPEAVLKVMEWL